MFDDFLVTLSVERTSLIFINEYERGLLFRTAKSGTAWRDKVCLADPSGDANLWDRDIAWH